MTRRVLMFSGVLWGVLLAWAHVEVQAGTGWLEGFYKVRGQGEPRLTTIEITEPLVPLPDSDGIIELSGAALVRIDEDSSWSDGWTDAGAIWVDSGSVTVDLNEGLVVSGGSISTSGPQSSSGTLTISRGSLEVVRDVSDLWVGGDVTLSSGVVIVESPSLTLGGPSAPEPGTAAVVGLLSVVALAGRRRGLLG